MTGAIKGTWMRQPVCVSFYTQENGNILLKTGVITVGTVLPGEIGLLNKRAGGQ